MEHPLQVDELPHIDTPPAIVAEPAPAPLAAPAAAPLPPLPDPSTSDVLFLAMRPFMPGAAYVNYCDLDLADYATTYWGDNLPRLMAVKAEYDPDNLFRHAQSVPLRPAAQA